MRASGILMHITSLPGPYGIGTMGAASQAFVDFLAQSGQRWWQILPLSPTGYGDSPYQSCSAFAGNHYLIDLDILVQQGLLLPGEPDGVFWGDREDRVDFGLQYANRLTLLRRAFARFTHWEALDAFCREQADWLWDFALYMALKDRYQGKPWYSWPQSLKFREPGALEEAKEALSREITFYCFVQYLFFTQWQALRDYAHRQNVQIMGDVPIYVPYDSADVWKDPQLFQLDEGLTPTAVAGVPPDYFSQDGQLWGNPLYRWDVLEQTGYRWWINRLGAAGKLYDAVRIDHFRAFESYWAVPNGEETAKNGSWVKGPGLAFLKSVQNAFPELFLVAEDLGMLTQEVFDLRDSAGLPGMKILQFAFDSPESQYLPHNHTENALCYTGTHDNLTLTQWLETLSPEVLSYAAAYMALTEAEGYAKGVIRTAMASVCRLCIIPLQDWLELGEEARMNTPGVAGGNWTWRTEKGACTPQLSQKIYAMTRLYGRL